MPTLKSKDTTYTPIKKKFPICQKCWYLLRDNAELPYLVCDMSYFTQGINPDDKEEEDDAAANQ